MNELREWSGSPDPRDPDNYWIDEATNERVNASTGVRTALTPADLKEIEEQLQRAEATGLARCPDCGMPTIPDHQGLTEDEMRCDQCYRHDEVNERESTVARERRNAPDAGDDKEKT
jgi:hypothetical protein